jgi:sec-independent protein translocase protein TatA
MIGAGEWLIVGAVIFVLFGSTAIPKFARSLGKAKKEFEKGLKSEPSEDDDEEDKDKKS